VRRSGRALALGLSLLAACDARESQQSQAGRLEAQWSGADSGKISGQATAEWCADRLWLEIRAIRGDTGLAMALYPVDSIVSDSYPVVAPTRADSVRPAASMALRLFSPTAVKGYRGDSGAVLLVTSGSGQISGRLRGSALATSSADRVRISGKFERVAVVPQERGCTPKPPDTTADTIPDTTDAAPDGGQID
jgi:hypothetical protein